MGLDRFAVGLMMIRSDIERIFDDLKESPDQFTAGVTEGDHKAISQRAFAAGAILNGLMSLEAMVDILSEQIEHLEGDDANG